MLAVLGILLLVILPALIGAVREARIDRQLREAERGENERGETGRAEAGRADAQKSSSRSTVPSTATWYAEGRRSKKLVSS